jgi:hypothetical protein
VLVQPTTLTHADPAPAAIPCTLPENAKGRVTSFVVGSIRATVPSA